MAKPPIQKSLQSDFIHTAVRLPPALHANIHAAAQLHGHSMNAEIIARLEAAPLADQVVALVARENAELKRMIQKLLEK